MSTKRTPKAKLNEVAKDLDITNQELIDFISAELNTVKKPTASLTDEEMTYVLEYYTQHNQVESFDSYYATRNDPAPASRAAEKKEKKTEKPKASKEKETPAKKAEAAPKKQEAQKAAPKKENRSEQKPKQENAAPSKQTEKPAASKPKTEEKKAAAAEKNTAVKSEQRSQLERFNRTIKKADEHKKSEKEKQGARLQDKSKEQQKKKQTLDVKFGEGSAVMQNIHTVDTRGSYVEIDKYNERYENMANTQSGGSGKRSKDNFSKKQKITQKSAQRSKQQYSSKRESEADKLRRLELERARKQQLKVLIPDEIVVSELASRLKVTSSEVIKKLMGLGEMCTINQVIDFDTASLVAEELGAKVEKEIIVTIE